MDGMQEVEIWDSRNGTLAGCLATVSCFLHSNTIQR